MRVLVTGGAGFIGSHMAEHMLSQGFTVRVIDNMATGRETNLAHLRSSGELTLDQRDLRVLQPNDSLFRDAEFVYHFAGLGDIVPSIERPTDYMSCNVMGTVHALECARFSGVKKFIYAASSSCYGLAQELPTTETAALTPQYPYALSKLQGEQATFHWGQVYNLPVNSIRMFNIYGTRSRTTGVYGAVFGVFLKQKLANKPFTVVGDGTQRRDFVYASDVARAFHLLSESKHVNQVYNLGAGKPQTINRIIELLGGGEVIHLPKRPGEPETTWADIAKLTRDTGWTPQISIEEGIGRMLDQISYWSEAPLWDPESISKATAGWFNALSR